MIRTIRDGVQDLVQGQFDDSFLIAIQFGSPFAGQEMGDFRERFALSATFIEAVLNRSIDVIFIESVDGRILEIWQSFAR